MSELVTCTHFKFTTIKLEELCASLIDFSPGTSLHFYAYGGGGGGPLG